jgi:hypothetical protein
MSLPTLLSVRELGGYPDFSPLYRQCGYRVVPVQGIRKALAALKTESPQVVVAEFNYAPTHGTRISTVEALLARLQTHHASASVLLFAEKEHFEHLKLLESQYGSLNALTHPVGRDDLHRWLSSLPISQSVPQ